ncbi:DUF3761 domain-containing protein [Streptomyces sp. NPDC091027]|uniref:DUF3761 domain-containing protein n=1 Tax=Streptomyces sp. NPDC091027 TaxID=3365971 RepID=UPI0038108CC7
MNGAACRYHLTEAEREASAKAARDRHAQAERKERWKGLATVIGLGAVTLAILAGMASCSWSVWEEQQREAACEPHREKALALDQEAGAVKIPMVLYGYSQVPDLALRRSLTLGEVLGNMDAPSATERQIADAYERKRELAGRAAQVVLEHRSCLAGYVAAAERIEEAPTEVTRVQMPAPARCVDGWPSSSIGKRGACSHHGGVVDVRPWAVLYFD